MTKKDVTIYDLAIRLNVSPSTISRGLKEPSPISKKTRQKILAAAAEMGFHLNHVAANLRTNRTFVIGVIVAQMDCFQTMQLLSGIEKVTSSRGYQLLIAQSMHDPGREVTNIEQMLANRVDGLLASLTMETEHLKHLKPFVERGIPVMLIDNSPPGAEIPYVSTDQVATGYLVTRHLIERGARRILFAAGNPNPKVYRDRLEGHFKALHEYDIRHDDELVIDSKLTEQEGPRMARHIHTLGADGAFIADDNCAAFCIAELNRLNVCVPRDVVLAGLNNEVISRQIYPPMTTMDYPGIKMGEIAANKLIDRLQQKSTPADSLPVIMKPQLVVRSSS